MENDTSIAALQLDRFATPFVIVTMESRRGFASYLVSSVSFGDDHLGRYGLSKFY